MSVSCRGCGRPLPAPFLTLGDSPVANAFLSADQLDEPEPRHPLDVHHCPACHLVQLPEVERADAIFNDRYAYFSSFSDSWLAHCERYCAMIRERLALGPEHFILEIASNDGYLLQYLVAAGLEVLGVEPAANTAAAARARGVPTEVAFFSSAWARELVSRSRTADLIIANNVLAHTPTLDDFVAGLAIALSPTGTATIEVPHLLELLEHTQFDTIYHEHYSYFSLLAVSALLARHDLDVYDVERLPTHGGSLRLYIGHGGAHAISAKVGELLALERASGLDTPQRYASFGEQVALVQRELVAFLREAHARGAVVVGYGAPAKGNTLLNTCGVTSELIAFTVDRSPHKQGLFLPGSHIPIHAPERILEARPDYVLILPWNLEAEIVERLPELSTWGGRFVVPIPRLRMFP